MLHPVTADENAGTMYLTARQREVHQYIRRYFSQYREGPTREEIQHAFGFRSPNAAQYYVEVLASKGAINYIPDTVRGIVPMRAPLPPLG